MATIVVITDATLDIGLCRVYVKIPISGILNTCLHIDPTSVCYLVIVLIISGPVLVVDIVVAIEENV